MIERQFARIRRTVIGMRWFGGQWFVYTYERSPR